MADFFSFINGKPASGLDVRDRGLAYGHGVFETMRTFGGRIPLVAYHLNRLMSGLAALGISADKDLIVNELGAVLTSVPGHGVLKLIITAGSAGRGYRLAEATEANRICQWFPFTPARDLVRLQLCGYTLPSNPHLAGIKHLNRLDQVLAARELVEDNLGLMLDSHGNVIEAISHNVFLRAGRQWLTPSLRFCGVAGVMRAVLVEEVFPCLGETITETNVSLDQLLDCDECFVCNAVTGVQAVSAIMGKTVWRAHGHTRKVQSSLKEIYPCYTG